MPKSKRNRVVALNQQAVKRVKKDKEALVDDLRDCLSTYSYLWVLQYENMRNSFLKELRIQFRSSRFFFGKNKVMQVALGRDSEEELQPGLAQAISGQCGLFFTNEKKEYIQKFFEEYSNPDYARSGFPATETVKLSEGPIDMPFSMEPRLRQLGLPTLLRDGVIQLLSDRTVCTKGQVLTPDQAKLLKLLDIKMAHFRLLPVAVWSPNGEFETFELPEKVVLGSEDNDEFDDMTI